jgi:sirohydrochlorin cobaltochelatase
MRSAIVLVSFGSANLEGLKNSIFLLEKEIYGNFNNVTVVKAFTSNKIINILKEKHDIYVKRLDQCLFDLANDQYEEVIIQPLNIMEEALNKDIQKIIEEYRYCFKRIAMSNSILAGKGDNLKKSCDRLAKSILDRNSNLPILLVGHGSKINSNECYSLLRSSFEEISGRRTFLATLEGNDTLIKAIEEMNKEKVTDIVLQSLFLIQGRHLTNDILGVENSWINILKDLGFNIIIKNKALLQYESVRKIYVNDLKSLF